MKPSASRPGFSVPAAEDAFRAWLSESGVAFLTTDHPPISAPAALRGRIRQPDYLVGIPHTGTMAFHVHVPVPGSTAFAIDIEDVDQLAAFAAYFHVTVILVCLDPEEHGRFYWIPLHALIGRAPETRGKVRVVAFPRAEAFQVQPEEPFLQALMRFTQTAARLPG